MLGQSKLKHKIFVCNLPCVRILALLVSEILFCIHSESFGHRDDINIR